MDEFTDYIDYLSKNPLFFGLNYKELSQLLTCLPAKVQTYKRNSFVLHAGDTPDFIGIVLDGEVNILRTDDTGAQSVLAKISPSGYFGEALALSNVEESPVSVLASRASKILILPAARLLDPCEQSCGFHHRILINLLRMTAVKNTRLQSRMELLEMKSLRLRILAYLRSKSPKDGTRFLIPLNRNELAQYLAADRSALSRELSRLKAEGEIDYEGNYFILCTVEFKA